MDRVAGLIFAGAVTVVCVAYARQGLAAPVALPTRMTAEQAGEAAAEAASATFASAPFGGILGPRAYQQDGRLLWEVRSATIGSGWTAVVDDATGECLEVKRWGIR